MKLAPLITSLGESALTNVLSAAGWDSNLGSPQNQPCDCEKGA